MYYKFWRWLKSWNYLQEWGCSWVQFAVALHLLEWKGETQKLTDFLEKDELPHISKFKGICKTYCRILIRRLVPYHKHDRTSEQAEKRYDTGHQYGKIWTGAWLYKLQELFLIYTHLRVLLRSMFRSLRLKVEKGKCEVWKQGSSLKCVWPYS